MAIEIGERAPEFELPDLKDPTRTVNSRDYRGRWYVVNVWGTWCAACRVEHNVLLQARRSNVAPIIGLNLRDEPPQVLAVHPGPIEFARLPFVNVSGLLAAMPVPVPRILAVSDALGIIALQDLGDVTLQAHLGAASPAEHAALYREAVALIETMQRRGTELASPDYVPYGIAFDVEKLTWELDFFIKHFIEAYRGVVIPGPERDELRREFAVLVEELAAEPRVLCHRDYHSRNLMLHHDRLYIIDFQDARMGPDTYDLVSLLRDAYVRNLLSFTATAVRPWQQPSVEVISERLQRLTDRALKKKGARVLLAQVAMRISR